MNWSLLPTISAPMPFQMALDGLLFSAQKKETQAPVLRFYISSEPWISAGYSFRDASDLSKSQLIGQHPRVPVCRRVTGGGCVLHGQDLIFSLVAPLEDPVQVTDTKSLQGFGPVRASYQKIHEAVKLALQQCGLDPKFYDPDEEFPKGSDCFNFPVESDLSWKGQKIAGGAQKRSEGVLLHHESIQIPPGMDRKELIRALRQAFETVWGISIQDAGMDPEIYFFAGRSASNAIMKMR